MPVLNVWLRILNISAVRSRIGEIKALVDDRKVGDDVALNRLDERRPVVERRVFDLAPFQTPVLADANPMQNLAAPTLHRAERATPRRNLPDRDKWHSVELFTGSVTKHFQRSLDLIDPDLNPVANIAILVDGGLHVVLCIIGIGVIAADIQVNARGPARDTYDAQIPSLEIGRASCRERV